MVNRNGQKGATYERMEADHFRDNWPDGAAQFIDRQVKTGNKDKGDLSNVRIGPHKVAVEIKTVKQNRLSEWIGEAAEEADNLGALAGIVVHKRVGKGKPQDQYVSMTVDTLFKLIAAARSAGEY